MSNRVYVQFTQFQNIDENGNPMKEPDFGYRIFDDEDAEYNNSFESVEEMIQEGLNQDNILSYVRENHFDFYYPTVLNKGLYFNGKYIPPDEIGTETDPNDDDDDDIIVETRL